MRRKLLKVICASVITASVLSASAVAADPVKIFDSDSKSLQLDGVAAVADYQGAASAILEFTYTNKTNEAKAPIYEYFPTVFQDGVSLANTTILDSNYASLCASSLTQVKDGTSVSYAVAYKLNDLTTDLEVEIKDAIAGGNVQSFTIPVSGSGEVSVQPVNWEEKYNELLKQYEELEAAYNALLEEAHK